MRANSAGSFSLTQASLEAVKLPGEFSRRARQRSGPSARNARSPMPTARLSHQMMAGRSTRPRLVQADQAVHLVGDADRPDRGQGHLPAQQARDPDHVLPPDRRVLLGPSRLRSGDGQLPLGGRGRGQAGPAPGVQRAALIEELPTS